MYILLLGKVPFKGSNLAELNRNIQNGILPLQEMKEENLSGEALDLIQKILVVNVKSRITLDHIIEHPFLKGHKTQNNMSAQSAQLDEAIIQKIQSMGYTKQYIHHALNKKGLSHVNAIYSLLASAQ